MRNCTRSRFGWRERFVIHSHWAEGGLGPTPLSCEAYRRWIVGEWREWPFERHRSQNILGLLNYFCIQRMSGANICWGWWRTSRLCCHMRRPRDLCPAMITKQKHRGTCARRRRSLRIAFDKTFAGEDRVRPKFDGEWKNLTKAKLSLD
jgi:hypothetical protein